MDRGSESHLSKIQIARTSRIHGNSFGHPLASEPLDDFVIADKRGIALECNFLNIGDMIRMPVG